MKHNVKLKIENGKLLIALFFAFSILHCQLSVSAQTGGTFDLSHSVIAAGGGSNSAGGNFILDGTAGQPSAGTSSTGGQFGLRGGFWASDAFAPTAAEVSISGLIRTSNGHGIRGVQMVLTNAVNGQRWSTSSSTFGYYRFEQIPVGQTYLLSVISRRFVFQDNTRIINLNDELTDMNFIANPE